MTRRIRLLAGLYGLVFHAIVAGVVVGVAHANQVEVPLVFWAAAVPAMLAGAALVYATLVASYLSRRAPRRGLIFYDSAVGMLAEVAIMVVTAVLYAVLASGGALAAEGLGGYLAAVASGAIVGFLWSFGSFFTQLLVVGNAAGLVGWWTLEKLPALLARVRRAG